MVLVNRNRIRFLAQLEICFEFQALYQYYRVEESKRLILAKNHETILTIFRQGHNVPKNLSEMFNIVKQE